jgi:cytochrome o ubiquinol oxidase subunit 1
LGVYIGALSLVFGFAIVWHLYWLSLVAFGAVAYLLIARSTEEETEYCLPAGEVAKMDAHFSKP